MKDTIIKDCRVNILKAGLIQPFRIATGQHSSLENVAITIELKNGKKGTGEAAIATHITGETVKETVENLRKSAFDLQGRDVRDYLGISAAYREKLQKNKSALAAIETALLDAFAKEMNVPLWRLFGPRPDKLRTDITIVIADTAESGYMTKKFYSSGFRIFKIKIGNDPEADFLRVSVVKKIAPKCDIYLDMNQGYTPRSAVMFVKKLKKYGICPLMVEQPVKKEDIAGLKKVTRSLDVPVCADESASSVKDVARLLKEKAVDVINIKFMKSGIIEGREIAYITKAAGVSLMMGSMVETVIASGAAAHFAAGIGGFKYIDLDTPFFVKGPYSKSSYLSPDGVYDLSLSGPGIGVKL